MTEQKGGIFIIISQVDYTRISRGVPRIWQGGGQEFFFFRFGNLHVAKRHAAHGVAMRFARGVRGHAPPRNFLKWCVLVYILIRFCP